MACTLGPVAGAARMARWARLSEDATPTVRPTAHCLEVRYRPGPGIHEELEALAAAEATCCGFVDWTVTEVAGHPTLHITADL